MTGFYRACTTVPKPLISVAVFLPIILAWFSALPAQGDEE